MDKAIDGNCDQVLASHILVQFFVMVIQTIVTLSTIIFGKKHMEILCSNLHSLVQALGFHAGAQLRG